MPKRNFIDSPRPYVSAAGAPAAVQFWDRIYRARGYWLDWLVFQASIQHHDQWLARNRNPLPLEVRSKQLWQIVLSAALGEKPNPFRQLYGDFVLAIPRSEQPAFLLAHLQGCLILSGLDEREAQRCLVQFIHQRPEGIVHNQLQLHRKENCIVAVDLLKDQSLVQPAVILPWTNDLADHDACGISSRAPTRYVRNELWYGGVDSDEKTAVRSRTIHEPAPESRYIEAIDELELCKLLLELHRFSEQVGLLEVTSISAVSNTSSNRDCPGSAVAFPIRPLANENAMLGTSPDHQAEMLLLWDRSFLRQGFAKEWSALRESVSKVIRSSLSVSPDFDNDQERRCWAYFCEMTLCSIAEHKQGLSFQQEVSGLSAQLNEVFLASGVVPQMVLFIRNLSPQARELVAFWMVVGKNTAQGMSQADAFIAATEIFFNECCSGEE